MSTTERRALVCALAHQLLGAGSWCGETHLQKAVYVAKRWLNVPEFEDYEFILYMYGPFSFELQEELREMRADDWIRSCFPPGMPYGPTLRPVKPMGELPKFREREFAFIAGEFNSTGVAGLERLTAALFATDALGEDAPASARIDQLSQWKLRFSKPESRQAVRNADNLLRQVGAQFNGGARNSA